MLCQLRQWASMGVLLGGLFSFGCQGGPEASSEPDPAEKSTVSSSNITEYQVTSEEAAAMAAKAVRAGIKLQAPRIPRPEEIQKSAKITPVEDMNDSAVGQVTVKLSQTSIAGGAR